MSHVMNEDPYKDVDWENEDNLPPSELLHNVLGLAIAVLGVVCSGAGAIISEMNDGSAVKGAIIGGIVGVALAIVFVIAETTRLRRKGR